MGASVWYYIDMQSTVQGPFNSQQLHQWSGYFKDDNLFHLACNLGQHPQPCPPHQQPLYGHAFYPKTSFFAKDDPRGPPFTYPVSSIPLSIVNCPEPS
ncbi:unnamed protein product [Vitrella brassicaformis CCMP3155]|uniref:GYF domain-containing protein n=1 Tax=Vitrella brassicaformis (strain CCMP3155) TaxID=1169540 RepID=A0A0G4FIM2_VITBC|nr:unnamed protein product [Vitrella brassicaformis CCMP3155]|mmetsp:Transcript_45482/g.128340  ORF Transcript_45482/g.128340 Transcript_45482/m.128340 type:complete len:98 (+) Transcript_45482:725-1018(+)|eukprot:CEM13503.1 unnamed protein product [Vitrella brassicaformis CCMP3155]